MGDYDFITILGKATEEGKKLSTKVRMNEKQKLVLANKNDRENFLNNIIIIYTNLNLEMSEIWQYVLHFEDSEFEMFRTHFLAGLTSSVHYQDIDK